MKKTVDGDIKLFEFVKKHLKDDPLELVLKYREKDLPFDPAFAALQIDARRKTARKLPDFTAYDTFLFPSLLSTEQASHQDVARYHARLAGRPGTAVDMTAGLGIDAFALAETGHEVTALELDEERYKALCHNAEVLGLRARLKAVHGDSLRWLSEMPGRVDLIFVDPARRNQASQRTFMFKDCLPDITTVWEMIKAKGRKIMIKASPIIDLKQTLRELPGITAFHIVCVKGECKEVLCIADHAESTQNPEITVADIKGLQTALFRLKMSERGHGDAPIHEDPTAAKYLYDPHSGIHKADCGDALCRSYPGLFRVARETDLYVSDELILDFPGRIFKIDNEIRKIPKVIEADVAVRNYPLTAEALATKLKAKGAGKGSKMVFGMRAGIDSKPTLLVCTRFLDRDLQGLKQ